MACGCLKIHDGKHQIQREYGDEQADAGRDCRNRLARPNFQVRTRTGEYHFPCSADHEQDWQPYPVDQYSCYICDHTFLLLVLYDSSILAVLYTHSSGPMGTKQ